MLDNILNTQIHVPAAWIGYAVSTVVGFGIIFLGQFCVRRLARGVFRWFGGFLAARKAAENQRKAELEAEWNRRDAEREREAKQDAERLLAEHNLFNEKIRLCANSNLSGIWREMVIALEPIYSYKDRVAAVENFVKLYDIELPTLTMAQVEVFVNACGDGVRPILLPFALESSEAYLMNARSMPDLGAKPQDEQITQVDQQCQRASIIQTLKKVAEEDSHWSPRETAIKSLISLMPESRNIPSQAWHRRGAGASADGND